MKKIRIKYLIFASYFIFMCLAFFSWNGEILAVETPPGWLSDYGRAIELSEKTSKPILMDVYASWCSFCEKLHDHVYPSQIFKTAASDFITLSLNGEKHPEIVRKFEISGTPVIIFLDKNGYELERVTGYVNSSQLAEIMMTVRDHAGIESKLMSELTKNPGSVLANYEAGVYYSDTGKHEKARKYFIHAWNSSEKEPYNKKMDSLYNSAVSSMEMEDYRTAISNWNVFLLLVTEKDEDYAFARFYRGISYKFIGDVSKAREDLTYARDHLRNETFRRSAIQLLSRLK